MLRNSDSEFGLVARFFHWAIFLMIAGAALGAILLDEMPPGATRSTVMGLHKSFGVAILLLAVLRLAWRFANPRPAALGNNRIENALAPPVHFLLYALIIAQPICGILMVQSGGYPVSFFGLFQLPTFLTADPGLHHTLKETHETLAGILMAVVGIHALAALKHHFLDKNRTLMRMLVGR